jgi:hypothetical protein
MFKNVTNFSKATSMEEGVHLVALVSSLEPCQTREVIQRHLRSYIHQVMPAKSYIDTVEISDHIFIR